MSMVCLVLAVLWTNESIVLGNGVVVQYDCPRTDNISACYVR